MTDAEFIRLEVFPRRAQHKQMCSESERQQKMSRAKSKTLSQHHSTRETKINECHYAVLLQKGKAKLDFSVRDSYSSSYNPQKLMLYSALLIA